MVKRFGSRVEIADQYCGESCRFNAFNLRNIVTVQFSKFFLSYGSLFWLTIKSKKTTQTQAFFETTCFLIRGAFSTWVITSNNLSISRLIKGNCSAWLIFSNTPYEDVNPQDHFSQTVCHYARQFAPLEKTFTDKLWNTFKYFFKYIQSVFKMKDSDLQILQQCFFWLVLPLVVFPYILILYLVTLAAYFFCD